MKISRPPENPETRYGEDSCIWFHVEHAEMICLAIEKLRKEIVGG